jgi:hypothetical protein
MGKLNPETYLQDVENGNNNVCNKISGPYENEDIIQSNTYGKLDGQGKLPPLEETDKENDISNDISIQISNINNNEDEPKHRSTPGELLFLIFLIGHGCMNM